MPVEFGYSSEEKGEQIRQLLKRGGEKGKDLQMRTTSECKDLKSSRKDLSSG